MASSRSPKMRSDFAPPDMIMGPPAPELMAGPSSAIR
jgi:hypothetical protein